MQDSIWLMLKIEGKSLEIADNKIKHRYTILQKQQEEMRNKTSGNQNKTNIGDLVTDLIKERPKIAYIVISIIALLILYLLVWTDLSFLIIWPIKMFPHVFRTSVLMEIVGGIIGCTIDAIIAYITYLISVK